MTNIHSVSTPRKMNRLSKMRFDRVSLVPAGDDPMAQVVISKAAPNEAGGIVDPETITKDDLAPEVVAYIEGLEAEVDDLTKSTETLTTENETLTKSLQEATDSGLIVKSEEEQFASLLEKADPAVRVLLQKQAEEVKKANEIAKAERDARLDREFLAKAETMPMINTDKTTLGGLLRRIGESLSAEDAAEVEKMLSTANTQIAKSNLFGEVGRGGSTTTISKSVEAKAEELRKADPALTPEMAVAKAYAENPDLLTQAMTGQEN